MCETTAPPRLDTDQLRDLYRSGLPAVFLMKVPDGLPHRLRGCLEELASCPQNKHINDGSLLGRVMARRAVEICCDVPLSKIQLTNTPRGQPRVMLNSGAARPGVSISHSKATIAVALSACGRIGIDLERLRPMSSSVVTRVFASDDAGYLRSLCGRQQEYAFARLWTVAEACAKARGIGLEMLLNRMGPLGHEHEGIYEGDLRWATGLLYGNEAAAIACDRLRPTVGCIQRAPEMTLDELIHAC
jgi:phosphopantetheinyl transferase